MKENEANTIPDDLVDQNKVSDDKYQIVLQKLKSKEIELSVLHGEFERQKEQTKLAVRQNEKFAYIVSHDLKAPLRAIINLSEWIEDDLKDLMEGDTKKQMDLLRGRARRMANLIEGLLQISRVGREKIYIDFVDTRVMLNDIVNTLDCPDGFHINVGDAMPSFKTNHIRLRQVFHHLIENAVRFHDREDGRIEITVRDLEDFYEFSVADDGPGIAPENHERVFVVFQTLQSRDSIESTGVGLTLVKKIIEQELGGAINLKSEKGKGAALIFTWPKESRIEETR